MAESGLLLRSYPLEDIRILSRAQGSEYADGRTVEALIAVWDRPAEIVDGQGHYIETIGRTAFDKVIRETAPNARRARWNVGVFYNHGMTLHGTPSDVGAKTIGAPLDIRADTAGLLTVTRYNNTAQADDVLEMIRNGDITGHSFTGRIIKSNPQRPPRGGYRLSSTNQLTQVHRLELGLREYGPTPFPAYVDTAVVGVRSLLPTTQHFLTDEGDYVVRDDEETVEEADEPIGSDTPSDEEAVTDEPPGEDPEHSSRSDTELARLAVRQRIAMLRRTRPGLARSEGDTK